MEYKYTNRKVVKLTNNDYYRFILHRFGGRHTRNLLRLIRQTPSIWIRPKHPHGNHRQQPPRSYHEDTGEFTQEELDYWCLNQQDDED